MFNVSRLVEQQRRQIFPKKIQGARRQMCARAVTVVHPVEGAIFASALVPLSEVVLACYSLHEPVYAPSHRYVGWLRGYLARWNAEDRVVDWSELLYSYDMSLEFGPWDPPRLDAKACPHTARLGLFLDGKLFRTYQPDRMVTGPRVPKLYYSVETESALFRELIDSPAVWASFKRRCKFRDEAHFSRSLAKVFGAMEDRRRFLEAELNKCSQPLPGKPGTLLVPLAFITGEVEPARIYADLSHIVGYGTCNPATKLPATKRFDNPAPGVLVLAGLDPEASGFKKHLGSNDTVALAALYAHFREEFGPLSSLLSDEVVDAALDKPTQPAEVPMAAEDWLQVPRDLGKILRRRIPADVVDCVSDEDLAAAVRKPNQPLRIAGLGVPFVFQTHGTWTASPRETAQYNFAGNLLQTLNLGAAPEATYRALGFEAPLSRETCHVVDEADHGETAAAEPAGEASASTRLEADAAAVPAEV